MGRLTVSLQRSIRRKPREQKLQRLNRAREAAQSGGARAAERIGPAAQRARDVCASRIAEARAWTAPQLERTAHYVERDLGPRVGTLLHSTANKVKPARPRGPRRMIAAFLLAVGTLAGTIGVLARRNGSVRGRKQDEDVPAAETTMSEDGQVHTP